MSFPLPNKGRAVTRRWGPRPWGGVTMNHDGIDSGFADGTAVIVEHPGKLVAAPDAPDRLFGFTATYQVTPELRVSYHQLRKAGRGAVDLVPGVSSVGFVGNPLVKTPLAERPRHANWSGPSAGLTDRSGPHVHTQCWRLENGSWTPVDPDSAWVAEQIAMAEEADMPTTEQITAAVLNTKSMTHPITKEKISLADVIAAMPAFFAQVPQSVWDHRLQHPVLRKPVPASAFVASLPSYFEEVKARDSAQDLLIRQMAAGSVNEDEIAERLVQLMPALDPQAIAIAAADEADRRERERLGQG